MMVRMADDQDDDLSARVEVTRSDDGVVVEAGEQRMSLSWDEATYLVLMLDTAIAQHRGWDPPDDPIVHH